MLALVFRNATCEAVHNRSAAVRSDCMQWTFGKTFTARPFRLAISRESTESVSTRWSSSAELTSLELPL